MLSLTHYLLIFNFIKISAYRFDYNKIKRRNGCFAVSSNIVRLQEAFAGTDFLNTEYKLEEIGTLEDGKEENLIQQFYKY